MRFFFVFCLWVCALVPPQITQAQSAGDVLEFSTVTRPPFSLVQGQEQTGFSIDLLAAITQQLGMTYTLKRFDSFGDMLKSVETNSVDGAIANISITASREEVLDFSLPIFEAGIQILMPIDGLSSSVFSTIFTMDILIAVLIAIGMLFGGGMLMWVFERNRQEFFNRPMPDALFPSFWWALNLVVNGGFEERMPRSPFGRVFAVLMVVSSLFVVSVFVAKITAAITVEAIQSNVETVSDLDGRRVGTIDGSTAASFLDIRGVTFAGYGDLESLLADFENDNLDAVVFDGPILAYYAATRGKGKSRLVERVFKPENYGVALPSGSPLREPFNRALLRLREDGTYAELVTKWFGSSYGNR